jgi:hypothetical protein
MARKPTAAKGGTAVANYDEELAALAGQSSTLTDSGGGGRFFSTRAGVLQFDDVALPGNQMCVIIGAWCLENVYYTEAFDADNRTPPTCFAFCKNPDEKDEMGPPDIVDEEDVFERQSDTCKDCPQNEWGSAAKGRGKACGNRRRLACLPAGTYSSQGRNGGYELSLIDDADHFRTCDEAYLKVPVMSGKGFDAFVKDVAEQFRKPLFAVYARVYLTPDPKSQFKVNFELIEPVADELIPVLLERYRKLHEGIDFPYTAFEEEEEEKPTRKAGASKKLTSKAKR